jgi:hypothetical protein
MAAEQDGLQTDGKSTMFSVIYEIRFYMKYFDCTVGWCDRGSSDLLKIMYQYCTAYNTDRGMPQQ